MSEISRKDFLRLTSWGMVAALLPINRINALDSILNGDSQKALPSDFETAKGMAAAAKQKFYLKSYAEAESLYLSAIRLGPNYIQFYDGLDNVYGAQHRYLDSIYLYKNGLSLNSDKSSFYDRAARSLLRLQTGFRSLAADYRQSINSSSLLNDAVLLYNTAIIAFENDPYLKVGLAKVKARINIAPLEDDYKVNRVFKNLKRENKNIYKQGLNDRTDQEIKDLILRVDTKKRRELITNEEIIERNINMVLQKKKFYDILQQREHITELDKIEYAENLFNIDYSDSYSLRKIKLVYYTNNKFFEFIEIKRKFTAAKRTFSSYLGLMDAMEIAYKKGQAPIDILDEALSIGTMLNDTWSLTFYSRIDIVVKMSKILLLMNKFPEAIAIVEGIMPIVDVRAVSINNRLMQYYAKIHFEQQDYEFAKNCMLIGAKEIDTSAVDTLIANNPKYAYVAKLANNKLKDTFKENVDLYYLLYNCYFMVNDNQKAIEILNRLLSNNPYDSFVLSRT